MIKEDAPMHILKKYTKTRVWSYYIEYQDGTRLLCIQPEEDFAKVSYALFDMLDEDIIYLTLLGKYIGLVEKFSYVHKIVFTKSE